MESTWEAETERRSGEVDSEMEKEYWSGEGEEPAPEAEAEWETRKECRSGEVEQGSVRSRHRSLCDT